MPNVGVSFALICVDAMGMGAARQTPVAGFV